MDEVDTPDLMIAVEHVVISLLRLAAFAGHRVATKDQGGTAILRAVKRAAQV
jgi:hypothetical protein